VCADLAYFTDGNFVHLFRLCQLLLEYQLFAWQASTVSNNLRVAKYAQLKAHVVKLKAKAAHAAAENKTLKKELRYCKQVVAALEKQYDMVSSGRGDRAGLGLGGELPSADELAAEVEKFLADRDDDGKGPGPVVPG